MDEKKILKKKIEILERTISEQDKTIALIKKQNVDLQYRLNLALQTKNILIEREIKEEREFLEYLGLKNNELDADRIRS